jgi:hypothetical protein
MRRTSSFRKRLNNFQAMAQPANYKEILAQLKAEIDSARIRASLTANVQLLALYWKI